MLTLAAVVVLIVFTRSPASMVTTVTVSAQNGRAAELAQGLIADLARLASTRDKSLMFESGKGSGHTDYLLTIAKSGSAGVRADVTLFRSGSPEVLWSASFAGRDADSLRPQIANGVFRVTSCALQTNNDPAQSSNDTLRLVSSGCERLDPDPDSMAVEVWRKIATRNPRNARALATLSVVEATWGELGPGIAAITPRQGEVLRTAARDHLRKARAMDGSLGLSYAAEASLLPKARFGDELALLDRGLAADPDCADLHALKVQALARVGRMDDALDSARRAAELEPSSAFHRMQLILALAYDGYIQSAKTELESAERIWPDSPQIREARFDFDFRFGDPKALLRQIDRGAALQRYSPIYVQNGITRAFLLARANPSLVNNEAAAKLAFNYRHAPHGSVQDLVALGRLDMAYRYLSDPSMLTAAFRDGDTSVLFRAYMRPFLFDRRFMGFADRIGLVRYWQRSRNWPDFCKDKDVPYDCNTEARRLRDKAT